MITRRSVKRRAKRLVSPGRYDPTGTASLRKAFVASLRSAYALFRQEVVRQVAELSGITANESWAADSNPRKVERFRAWLRERTGSALAGNALIMKYMDLGYRRGEGKVIHVGAPPALGPPAAVPWLHVGMQLANDAARVEAVKLLAARTFAEMEEVHSRMAARMSRALATGLMEGRSAKEIAKELAAVSRLSEREAARVARTELVRAFAEGQLAGFAKLGAKGVTAVVEYTSVGDGKVCEKCEQLDGEVFSLADARGVIPVHPECRCAWQATAAEPTLNFNPFHDRLGRFAEGPGEGGGYAASKYVGERVGKEEHVHSEHVEKLVARYLGGRIVPRVRGKQQATDVERGLDGFEVKSLLKGDKDVISVHPDALLRKVMWENAEPGRVFHTVVVDERGTYADGAYNHKYSGHRLYYKRGSGRYTLSNMHQVRTWGELYALSKLPDEELPPKARGRLPSGEELIKLQDQAERAHESRLRKDRARKQRLRDERNS